MRIWVEPAEQGWGPIRVLMNQLRLSGYDVAEIRSTATGRSVLALTGSTGPLPTRVPQWWRAQGWPTSCPRGHAWGPGLVVVGWTRCDCASGDGHETVSCGAQECDARWYIPAHQPSHEATLGRYPGTH